MNRNNLIWLGAGLGIGSVITYFVTKQYYKDIFNSEVESVTEYYKEENQKLNKQIEELKISLNEASNSPKEAVKEEKPKKDTGKKLNAVAKGKKTSNKDNKKARQYVTQSDPDDISEDSVVEDGHVSGKVVANGPRIISADDYCENNGYNKKTYTYFEEDDTLMDDSDEEIVLSDVVGSDNLTRFGEPDEDMDKLYIRNDLWGLDIEITKEEGSYSDLVERYEG